MTATTETEDAHGSSSFQKFPLTLVRGSGAVVWDDRGKEYVDFMAGYGVAIIGHSNPAVVNAVSKQAADLITCHGSFYNDARSSFLEKLTAATPKGLERAVLTNSGAESVEAAIKLARKHTGRSKIVSMKGGFHGKTYGALSATWNKKYREPFEPLVPGFEFADYGDLSSLAKCVTQETAAVIAEPIQGETGIIVPPDDYLRGAKELCDRAGALLILDEIQTGLGRTGKMWASEHWGVVPDIMTVAKGIGGGVPLGAAVARADIVSSLQKGEHTSTFAGNPLACAAGAATLDFIKQVNLPGMAAAKGTALAQGLGKIAREHRVAREVRGMGMMLALELRIDIQRLLSRAMSDGAIFGYSGRNTVRLLPPVVATEDQTRRGLEILARAVDAEEKAHAG